MGKYRYVGSLRIWHPSAHPDMFTSALGIEPDRCWQIGDARTTPKGAPLKGVWPETYWCARVFEGYDPPAELPIVLYSSMETIRGCRSLFHNIRAESGRIQFFTGWYIGFNADELFDYRLLGELADLKIDLEVDIYQDDELSNKEASGI